MYSDCAQRTLKASIGIVGRTVNADHQVQSTSLSDHRIINLTSVSAVSARVLSIVAYDVILGLLNTHQVDRIAKVH